MAQREEQISITTARNLLTLLHGSELPAVRQQVRSLEQTSLSTWEQLFNGLQAIGGDLQPVAAEQRTLCTALRAPACGALYLTFAERQARYFEKKEIQAAEGIHRPEDLYPCPCDFVEALAHAITVEARIRAVRIAFGWNPDPLSPLEPFAKRGDGGERKGF